MFPIKTELVKYRLRIKKRLGQNFLTDEPALAAIVDFCFQNNPAAHVLEIGAGIGNLSVLLAKAAEKFFALEKDPSFGPILTEKLKQFTHAKIIIADILESQIKDFFTGKKLTVAGNLPFYITTPILTHLLRQKEYINTILITVQKEVAYRIVASPGTKKFGRLSCFIQYHTQADILKIFPRHLFFPQPEVDAALIRLKILARPKVEVKSETFFFKLVKAIFSHKRKTLINSVFASGGLG
ncbi:MAG: 16S rRNA (adenine(1518)-N(6)/adenine(1519)-N(6))-dimethyltransferase RsmA, partial [Candidatus Omnitrophota bacterium]